MVLVKRAFSVQLRPPVPPPTTISISSCPFFRVMMEFSNYLPSPTHYPNFRDAIGKVSLSFLAVGCCTRISSRAAFLVNVRAGDYLDTQMDLHLNSDFFFDLDDGVEEERREAERRRKIGLANKGRVPWNKGRPHTDETRARIRQRTKEALRDPKVRRKMADSPRKLSDQVKAKISFSQRRLWAERLKCKRAKENFMMAWAGNVAQTAKKGGIGEDELHWDSYMLIKREMDFQIIKHAEEKAKALEMKRVRTEKAAQATAGKKALRAIQKHRSKERENKAKRKRNNQEKAKQVHNELDVESWLTKSPRKTSINGQISSQSVMLSQHFSLERLDLRVVEMEKLRKKVSLADEIQAAKIKRTESDANVGVTAVHPEQ